MFVFFYEKLIVFIAPFALFQFSFACISDFINVSQLTAVGQNSFLVEPEEVVPECGECFCCIDPFW